MRNYYSHFTKKYKIVINCLGETVRVEKGMILGHNSFSPKVKKINDSAIAYFIVFLNLLCKYVGEFII